MKKNNQKIRCDVDNCKHNDCHEKMCQLREVKVGCGCKKTNCKEDTVCDSFEGKKKVD